MKTPIIWILGGCLVGIVALVYISDSPPSVKSSLQGKATVHVPSQGRLQDPNIEARPSEHEASSLVPRDVPPEERSEPPLLVLARRDLQAALAEINAKYTGLDRDRIIGYLLSELGKDRLECISELLPLITNPSERASALILISKEWLIRDPSALTQFVHGQRNGMFKNQFMEWVVQSMGDLGRNRDAAQMLSSMPYSNERSSAIQSVASHYARTDARGAIDWLSSLQLPDEVATAQGSISASLTVNRDLDGLLLFADVAEKHLRPGVLAEIGKLAGEKGIAELQKVVSPQTPEYEQAVVGAMSSVPIEQLTELANQAIRFESQYLKGKAMAEYVGRVFAQDQQQAVQWVKDCPPEIRPAAIQAVVNKWFNTDSMAASEWINSMAPGSDRNVALEALAMNLRRTDKPTAREVASNITDRAKRESLLRSLR